MRTCILFVRCLASVSASDLPAFGVGSTVDERRQLHTPTVAAARDVPPDAVWNQALQSVHPRDAAMSAGAPWSLCWGGEATQSRGRKRGGGCCFVDPVAAAGAEARSVTAATRMRRWPCDTQASNAKPIGRATRHTRGRQGKRKGEQWEVAVSSVLICRLNPNNQFEGYYRI